MALIIKDGNTAFETLSTNKLSNGEHMPHQIAYTLVEAAMTRGALFGGVKSVTLETGISHHWSIETPAAPLIAFQGSIGSQSAATVELFEDATVTADGTLLDLPNSDRTSANTLGATVRELPTITVAGTVLFSKTVGAGESWNPQPGIFSSAFILKPNTTYVLKGTSNSAANAVSADLQFIELGDTL